MGIAEYPSHVGIALSSSYMSFSEYHIRYQLRENLYQSRLQPSAIMLSEKTDYDFWKVMSDRSSREAKDG